MNELTHTLTAYRTDLERKIEAINLILSDIQPAPTAPAAPSTPPSHPRHSASPAVKPSAASAAKPPRRSAAPRKPPTSFKGAAQALIRTIIAKLDEPFTCAQIRAYLAEHHPDAFEDMGASTLSTTLHALGTKDLIRTVGQRPGLRGPVSAYKRSPTFTAVPDLSPKEEAYRRFREENPTHREPTAADLP